MEIDCPDCNVICVSPTLPITSIMLISKLYAM
jgi:hypothetical protein